MTNESTTVVNQFTNSYKYILGASSRVFGVQLYSESSKKSSSLDVMIPVIRSRARESVADNEVAAVRRIIPPRCAVLKGVDVSLDR
jgi:hypothetical protein